MAKKSAVPRNAAPPAGGVKRGRPVAPSGAKRQILGIRGSDQYKEWLVRFAVAQRSDLVDLVDDALEAYAAARGFEAPPKR